MVYMPDVNIMVSMSNVEKENWLNVINAHNRVVNEVLKLKDTVALAEREVTEAQNADNMRAFIFADCVLRQVKKQLELAENEKNIYNYAVCYMRHVHVLNIE